MTLTAHTSSRWCPSCGYSLRCDQCRPLFSAASVAALCFCRDPALIIESTGHEPTCAAWPAGFGRDPNAPTPYREVWREEPRYVGVFNGRKVFERDRVRTLVAPVEISVAPVVPAAPPAPPEGPEVVVVLDTETTGLRPDGRVCEIACAALDIQSGRIIAKASSLVHPGVAIPQDATRVHGITDAMVRDAPRLVDVWPRALAFVTKHCPELFVIAHNAPFDRGVLGDDLGRHGVMPTEWPRWRWHDSITLAKRIVPGLQSYSLHDDPMRGRVGLVTSLKLAKGESHRAMGDVLTACALLIELRRRIARHWQSWRGDAHVWGMGIEKVERVEPVRSETVAEVQKRSKRAQESHDMGLFENVGAA